MAKPSLQDLIRDGKLSVGTELYHKGREYADEGAARVTEDGIDVAGKVYASPSGAARAVTKTAAENGWRWWRIRADDRELGELRRGG